MLRVIISIMTASRVRSSLVSSPICIPKLCMMCPMLFVFMYIALAISSANMRASWPFLQYNTSSRPVGKEAYPLKTTLVFSLAFAAAPNKNTSPLKVEKLFKKLRKKTRVNLASTEDKDKHHFRPTAKRGLKASNFINIF